MKTDLPRPDDELRARQEQLASELGEPVTLDSLTRDFRMFQRRRGHRHSTDDLLTAWYAATHAVRPVERMLDLGTGIGSVGLSVLWYFPDAPLTAIEVQPGSFRLLQENIWANNVAPRVTAIHGDLRASVPDGTWDLITGSPPYFDVKTGIVSADPQRAGARFELCGDVSDYCRAATRVLSKGGRFVFCFPTVQRARAERACADAKLALVTARDVVPRQGLPALFSLFACCHAGERAPEMHHEEPALVVRFEDGTHTPEMLAARALFGMGPLAADQKE